MKYFGCGKHGFGFETNELSLTEMEEQTIMFPSVSCTTSFRTQSSTTISEEQFSFTTGSSEGGRRTKEEKKFDESVDNPKFSPCIDDSSRVKKSLITSNQDYGDDDGHFRKRERSVHPSPPLFPRNARTSEHKDVLYPIPTNTSTTLDRQAGLCNPFLWGPIATIPANNPFPNNSFSGEVLENQVPSSVLAAEIAPPPAVSMLKKLSTPLKVSCAVRNTTATSSLWSSFPHLPTSTRQKSPSSCSSNHGVTQSLGGIVHAQTPSLVCGNQLLSSDSSIDADCGFGALNSAGLGATTKNNYFRPMMGLNDETDNPTTNLSMKEFSVESLQEWLYNGYVSGMFQSMAASLEGTSPFSDSSSLTVSSPESTSAHYRNHSVTDDESKGISHFGINAHSPVNKQENKLLIPSSQALEYKSLNEGVKHHPETEQILDIVSSKRILFECDDQESKAMGNAKKKTLSDFVNGNEEIYKRNEKPPRYYKSYPPPPGFARMKHLKRRKEARLRDKKIEPPPGFYRMKELKRQKEMKQQQQQQQQHKVASPSKSLNNRRFTPNRTRRSKTRTRRPQVLEESINGKIVDAIPEDISICLGSPSHKERVQKFQEMFHEEPIAFTMKRFLFE